VALAISIALNAVGVFTEEEIHWVNLLIGAAVAALATVIVFGLLVRRAARTPGKAARWGIGLGLAGVALAVAAFWSGLPPVFGVAAIYLGRVAWNAARGRLARPAIAAVVVGIVAVVADGVAYATDVASRY